MYAHTHHGGSEFPFPIRLWFGAVRIHNLGNEVLDRVSATSRVESLSFFALRFSMSSMPGGQPDMPSGLRSDRHDVDCPLSNGAMGVSRKRKAAADCNPI